MNAITDTAYSTPYVSGSSYQQPISSPGTASVNAPPVDMSGVGSAADAQRVLNLPNDAPYMATRTAQTSSGSEVDLSGVRGAQGGAAAPPPAGGNALSSIATLLGFLAGGPGGAALASGVVTLLGGGTPGQAMNNALTGGITSIPQVQSLMMINSMLGGGNANPFANMMGLAGGVVRNRAYGDLIGSASGRAATAADLSSASVPPEAVQSLYGVQAPQQSGGLFGGGGGLFGGDGGILGTDGSGIMGTIDNALSNPFIMAALVEALQPAPMGLSPAQQAMANTGERMPSYGGTPIQFNGGGYIEGPGTGTSDSIPAMIYQDGGPVQEARLSDGEFVMTEDAVRGMGDGNRNLGAARMYQMMNQLERRV